MRYETIRSDLQPHSYQHRLTDGQYIILAPKKGHVANFRIRDGCSRAEALQSARERGFKPVCVVWVKMKRKRWPAIEGATQ